jgi:hypothetical protein
MSRTIKAVERHMIPQDKVPPVRLGLQSLAAKLVAEWQQRGPETFSGHAFRKLRLALAPTQSVIIATAAGSANRLHDPTLRMA